MEAILRGGVRKPFHFSPQCGGGKYDWYDSQVAPRAIRAPALVVLKVLAGHPGTLFKHFARDEVLSHRSARCKSGLGSGPLEGFVVVRRPVSRERRGVRLGLNAVWMPEYH